MMVRRKVLAPHAELGVSLADGTCSLIVCLPRTRRYTRMTGQRNLSIPHTALKVGQSDGTCWHGLCLPHILSPHVVRAAKVKGKGRSFDANFKGCAESDHLAIQKGFALLLLAQK
ncbi:hypothetical protein AALG83_08715 [Christensenellaceae bacterium 44-20]